MPLKQTLNVACLQLCATACIKENLATIAALLQQHAKQGLGLVLLPENATLITSDAHIKKQSATQESYQKTLQYLGELAQQYHIFLVAGSLLRQDPQHPDKYYNHCPVFSPEGKVCARYDKMHRFDADLNSESWQESDHITAGASPTTLSLDTNWKLGLSICYDLRFPELYRRYSALACNIMTVPAAFTVPTGQAHWEILLRARAIENQSFVLAAGQSGLHQDGRVTYGHSMIIDPWGNILAQLEQGEGCITAQLSLTQQQDIQQRMPSLQHRRL